MIHAILGELQHGKAIHFPLDNTCPYLDLFVKSQKDFNKKMFKIHARENATWSLGGYLENRQIALANYPQMVTQERYFHLGIDINAPAGTPLYAPTDCTVIKSEYESGEGNYGGMILLEINNSRAQKADIYEHDLPTPIYLVFGHLALDSLPKIGTKLNGGAYLATIGDFNENGNFFHHTHLQALTKRGLDQGWMHKGYCTRADLATIDNFCPDPTRFIVPCLI